MTLSRYAACSTVRPTQLLQATLRPCPATGRFAIDLIRTFADITAGHLKIAAYQIPEHAKKLGGTDAALNQ
jgi:hypothetical protein